MTDTVEITEEYLEHLDNEKQMIPLTFDRLLKAFFENNEDIYKRFISSVIHLELDDKDMNIKIKNTELPVSNAYEYRKTTDFNVDINNNILLNIELNRTHFSSVKERNYVYHSKKISMKLKKGNSTKELKDIKNIQLNLNVKDKSKSLGEDIIVPYSIITNSVYLSNYVTYIRYLDYYRNLYYNNDIDLTEADYWLAMLTAKNYVELNEILSSFLCDELRIRIIKEVIRLNNDEVIFDEYEQMIGDALIDYEEKMWARSEGFEEGEKIGNLKGREEQAIKTIKVLLESKVDYETISKATGKTIDEIKEIENNLN